MLTAASLFGHDAMIFAKFHGPSPVSRASRRVLWASHEDSTCLPRELTRYPRGSISRTHGSSPPSTWQQRDTGGRE